MQETVIVTFSVSHTKQNLFLLNKGRDVIQNSWHLTIIFTDYLQISLLCANRQKKRRGFVTVSHFVTYLWYNYTYGKKKKMFLIYVQALITAPNHTVKSNNQFYTKYYYGSVLLLIYPAFRI
jgi:hypothetical protein